MSTNLPVPVSEVRRALAQAKTVPEILQIRHRAQSAIDYAKRLRIAGIDKINDIKEVYVLEAERRLGEVLADTEKSKGAAEAGWKTRSHDVTALCELGITKMQSHRAQLAWSVPEVEYRKWIAETREAGKELTLGGLIRLAERLRVTDTEVETLDGVVGDLGALIEAGKHFRCIYADPPWAYSNRATRASADKHYPVMSVEEICAEPIDKLCQDAAHLHLWTTNAFLPDAFKLIKAWGFDYKSCFVWVKPQLGIGNYWRVSHEFLLLGTRGRLPFNDRAQRSWLERARTEHSRKPTEVRDIIRKVSPGPYLELYGREAVADWVVYGNQVGKAVHDQA